MNILVIINTFIEDLFKIFLIKMRIFKVDPTFLNFSQLIKTYIANYLFYI